VEGADVTRIAETIHTFPPARHADLWSGVGLACAYAGSLPRPALESLREAAGSCRPHLAQGVAFAAKARLKGGNPTPHTDLACEVLCGLPSEEAAGVSDAALADLPPDGSEPAFEVWRCRVQTRFGAEFET